MIAILVAMEREASPLLQLLNDKTELNVANKKTYTGKLFGKDTVLAITGIGKVSAGLTTQAIIDRFDPEVILNYGSVGAVNNTLSIGEYCVINRCFQFDFDLREIDDVTLGYNQDYDRVFFDSEPINLQGLKHLCLGTSDKFTSNKTVIEEIIGMGCDVRDMEGAAIAQVCLSNAKRIVMIKGITDVYGLGTDGEQFYNNLVNVCKGFPAIIEKVYNLL